jgi:hypothetical protein
MSPVAGARILYSVLDTEPHYLNKHIYEASYCQNTIKHFDMYIYCTASYSYVNPFFVADRPKYNTFTVFDNK